MAIQFTVHKEIAASPDRVFGVLKDLEAARKWMPNLVGIEKLSPGRFGVGTKWRETRRMFGRDASELFEVTGLEPNKSLELYVDGTQGSSKRGHYRFRYQLEPVGGKTALTMVAEIGGMGFLLELFGRLMLGSFKKAITSDLDAMASYLEGSKKA
ncbi:polyketide cyclase/dehydrase/lipid transport protein [Archangium gephyra]|uniref:Carbon monoxide oxidation accessory protein CoxG n=1 Tax=Archangium gephyra TaxID=48 RepID=A0AAC8Q7L0_9BACT|nr:SRPBCC family protein [Archangium gephyra]AKJ02530.1 Carbon monoxide oxidation accessory protein CoxG [Archangium gephyra]REG28549.1 polyketide cyclase/dehydrase/lipid transport protein [Archangium gephyra]